ncbi:hypothetical protein RchiOBHm_Chr6g0258911 [Rosa chinensis]|uniref:Uncharacterized protein n=1 Tax=Rosa chinensis TaxID=74649 RepID=A0A2P6PMS6_ROSCH|nr:hypothetical protein RchiOBHm_Chr6g0258911 [Rosa chinensis]
MLTQINILFGIRMRFVLVAEGLTRRVWLSTGRVLSNGLSLSSSGGRYFKILKYCNLGKIPIP